MKAMDKIIQTSKQKFWEDEQGQLIPYSRITKRERLFERFLGKLLKVALRLNSGLKDYKQLSEESSTQAHESYMTEKGIKANKGNFTWCNFNRSVKAEVKVSERITFDDLGITAAKEKFNEFLNANIESRDQFIKQMVLDAFETSRGKLDAKKIMGLIRYKSKIKNQTFQQAVELLEESIRRPDSRTYYRLWLKNKEGDYDIIELNLSNIKVHENNK